MDQQPEMNVPAHVHGMWNVLSILFLVLFILSAVFNVFLFMSWSGQTDVVEDLEEDIEELVLDEELEDEIEELVLGEEEGEDDLDDFEEFIFADGSSTWRSQKIVELEGYLSIVERSENLLPISETDDVATCYAFTIIDGPDDFLSELGERNEIVFGGTDSIESLSSIMLQDQDYLVDSNVENTVQAFFFQGASVFEGEVVGCHEPLYQLIGFEL